MRQRRFRWLSVPIVAVGLSFALPAGALAADPSHQTAAVSQGVSQGGTAPTFSEQSAGWSQSQRNTYQAKLARLKASRNVASCPSSVTSCYKPAYKYLGFGLIAERDYNPNGNTRCGPASLWMALNQYMATPPSVYTLSTEASWDWYYGTARPGMVYAINNHHETANTYVWQALTLDSPSYAQGKADLWNYSTDDIWYDFPPIYNIQSSGSEGMPLWHWQVAGIQHYFPASGYSSSGRTIRVNDPWWPAQDTYGSDNIWSAIHNHPALDQVLW